MTVHPDTTETQNWPLPVPHGLKQGNSGYGTCSRGAEWTGYNACHCSAAGCHNTFTDITAFDKHRTGSHADGQRHCLDPASAGLVPVTKKYWTGWGCPGEDPRRDD